MITDFFNNIPDKIYNRTEENMQDEQPSNTPVTPHKYSAFLSKWERDSYGFLKNVDYFFKDDGQIDWRKMLPVKYLVVHKEKFKSETYFKTLVIEDLDDSQVLITLPGYKYLISLLGVDSIYTHISQSSEIFASCICNIEVSKNPYNNFTSATFCGVADAHINNVKGRCNNFLTTIAENRSFCRAARSALGISTIMSEEELSDNSTVAEAAANNTSTQSRTWLNDLLSKQGLSFDQFQNLMLAANIEGADAWKQISDVSEDRIFECMEIIKKKIAKDKKEKKSQKDKIAS